MQTKLEDVAKHRVKLIVEVEPGETKPVMDLAYSHLAEQVSIPGFRKGKVPRKIIDQQIGHEAVLREFLEHALPTFYIRAVREHELAPISDPEFEDVEFEELETKGLRFSATVEVRPRIDFEESDYKGLTIERPAVRVSQAEVDEQLERLRERFAELEVVGRPAQKGDFVVADIRSYVHDQEIPEVSGQDVLYEVGSEALVPELDKELEGAKPGDILKLNAKLPDGLGEHGGQEVSLSVIVKEVKTKRLPALDEEFAKTASEFDTLEALKADLKVKLGALKEAQSDAAVRDLALQELAKQVEDIELPDLLVDQETESRVRAVRERAERQGSTLEEVLRAGGVEELEFRADARAHALRAIRADLALEGVARAEEIRVSEEDLDKVVEAIAKDVGRGVKEVRKQLESGGQMTAVAGDIIRDRALDLVVKHAEVVSGGDETSEASERTSE
ncbi:MAG: trigger factor [Actinomycetota bacterium]